MRILFFYILIFILSACGSDSSSDNNPSNIPTENEPTNTNENNIKQLPSGLFQGECKNTTNGVGSDVRDARIIDSNNKTFVRVIYTFLSKNSTCTGTFLEIKYFHNYNDIVFDPQTNFFKVHMIFDKAIATFINSELDYEQVNSLSYYARNNWEYNKPQDVTHIDITGDYWIEPSGYYTLYFISDDNILNENLGDYQYKDTVDTNNPFYRKDG